MCLTTAMMKPFVAKEDFAVCKSLVKETHERYVTSIRFYPVNFNSELKPDTVYPETIEVDSINLCANIEGGAIHVYTENRTILPQCIYLFKAIVKKGIRFYASTDGTEIAAESLYITDEQITDDNPHTDEFNEAHEYIMSELREAAEQHNGVRVGDIMLSDKTYVHVEDYKEDSMRAIGVVGYFIDEKPVAVGLKTEKLQWCNNDNGNEPINVGKTDKEAYADYNGREYTNKLYAAYKDKLNDFPALEYCMEYKTEGTKKGDWHFPSSGEVANISRNLALINDSLDKIDGAALIDTDNCLWCSVEYSMRYAWYCQMNIVNLNAHNVNRYWYNIRPVFAK